MAGAEGFEPTHAWTKTRCLTTWLRPNVLFYFQNLINPETTVGILSEMPCDIHRLKRSLRQTFANFYIWLVFQLHFAVFVLCQIYRKRSLHCRSSRLESHRNLEVLFLLS